MDPNDSDLTASVASPGGTFRDPSRIPDVATARFVPRDPDDRDAYDAVFRWAFDHYPRYVWIDEAGQVAPVSGYPKAVNRYWVQGAKRALGGVACHTRPREIMKNFLAQAQHIFAFELPNPDDRRYLAEVAGIAPAVFEEAMAGLERRGFVYWNGLERTLTICPPLKGI